MKPSNRFFYVVFFLLFFSFQLASADDGNGNGKKTSSPVLNSLSPTTASQGASILLLGQNFGTGKGSVIFGSSAITGKNIISWNNTSTMIKVPKGKGVVNVKLVTSKNQNSNQLKFTYYSGSSTPTPVPTPTPTPVPTPTTVPTSSLTNFKVLANNDLGMHCVDKDFSVFSILPPYNVVNAQVVGLDSTGNPKLVDSNSVVLRYSPIPDSNNSINSTSKYKTNFWDNVSKLYGANLSSGQGIKGLYMPNDVPFSASNQQDLSKTSFSWNVGLGLFSAEGIPMLPFDDNNNYNPYPMLRVSAFDKTTNVELAHSDIVVPVSDETTCSNCHASGSKAALGSGWSSNPNLDVQTRTNILQLHDLKENTNLVNQQPVLCASCHYSPALDLAGNGKPTGNQVGHKWMSQVMHAYHSDKVDIVNGKTVYDTPAPVAGLDATLNGVPPADQQACYQCHPGTNTKCLRGAMTETVTCQNCHGDMKAVGADKPMQTYGTINQRTTELNRKAWGDEPRCQSCHTGDAVNHIIPAKANPIINADLAKDGIRLIHAYDRNDPAASPLLATNKRFAENDGKLFRFSKGHGQVTCEGCHNSTHAIWVDDNKHPNDNIASKDLQGSHAGTVSECTTCHKAGSLSATSAGPHGMHNVNDSRWAISENGHPSFYKKNPTDCKTCHGNDLKGTALSKVFDDRSWNTEWGTKSVKKGDIVGCYTCHNGPNGG